MRAALALIVLLAMPAFGASAQQTPTLDEVLDRLGRYLLAYESELSAVTAEETYSQAEYRGAGSALPSFKQRTLESDIAFLRLPGDAEWLGVRDVRKVDGRPVPGSAPRLPDLLKAAGADALAQAKAIVIASSKHNLGEPRTINMPTVPLELMHPRNHPRLIFKLGSFENVERVRTIRLEFEEFDSPTMVHDAEGNEILTRGVAWVEPDTGRLRRVQVYLTLFAKDFRVRGGVGNSLRVEFMMEPQLRILVPKEMREQFYVRLGRGEGVARYANYRRFTTSARIVPR
jgi:hypothetical protein